MTILTSLDPEAPKTFLTSDTHYGHKNIITFSNRPWTTVDEMDEGLIANYNEIVRPRDTCYFLGDISFYQDFDKTASIINQLNGNKILIYGNHDWKFRKDYPKCFTSCWDYFELRRGRSLVVMSHYPMLHWNKGHHGSLMLHGHSHGSANAENAGRNRYDVGVDNNDWKPVEIGFIVEKIESLKASMKERND
jgi:calcineurin-like phosphoesterase family protein